MPSAVTVATWRPGPAERVRSWLGDWLVVAVWLVLLTLLGLLVRPLLDGTGAPSPPGTRELLVADLAIALVTVVPYVTDLSVTESSPLHATVGKRWAGLRVGDPAGGPPGTGQVWLRNVVKALLWQLAHLGVSRAIFEVQLPLAATLQALALLLAAACVVPALVGGRGLHDRVAGTRVQRAARDAPEDGVG